MDHFELIAPYSSTGDQPEAIAKLTEGVENGLQEQVLLGVTGSGKTFTMANVIANVNRPTLVLAHNKTLAAQLCSEFREFFPNNAVEYFVSYYDYYQPEAYVPGKDVYIEKDSAVNAEIDKLRHSATSALFERRDVIIVASVSCIFSLGDPEEYREQVLSLRPGMHFPREQLIKRLVGMQYSRSDIGFDRNNFRVRGDVVEIFPSNEDSAAVRVELFGDEIERISRINTVTGEVDARLLYAPVYPASHYVTSEQKRDKALRDIEDELAERIAFFEKSGKLIEAQRIRERVLFDIEQIREIGFCNGVENYSRVLAGREPGSEPYTLLDYFPPDFLMFIDESHVTVPQVRGMSGGDTARKKNLIDYGFRLPSAYDNRPLKFDEFLKKKGQTIYVSATPGPFETQRAERTVEQIIRPTGLLDPEVEVRPVAGQIDDLLGEIRRRTESDERVLVTTLTKKMAEDLSEYLQNNGVNCKYMHYDIETIERIELLRGLRAGEFDVLVGINLLREGLDLPEVSLVAILDADKVTGSMRRAIDETERRRAAQDAYNRANGITPKTIVKEIRDPIEVTLKDDASPAADAEKLPKEKKKQLVEKLTAEMKRAAKELDFETAAALRDRIRRLM